ncbi:MAG TPA: hypothetical protein VM009_06425 [Terriglobales bacterium]|nr:hypothetical protein [Terriglobales bacterium]
MREFMRHWWVLALRSGLALALAVTIFLLQAWTKFSLFDAVTIPFLIMALSVYGIIDSSLLLYMSLQLPQHSPVRTVSLAQGVCGIAVGGLLLTVFFRQVEIVWFVYIITAQAAITGVFELLSGFRFRAHVEDEWACFAAGAASIAFAVLLRIYYDPAARHALDWFLAYALLLGVSLGWFAHRLFTLHRLIRRQQDHHPHLVSSD